MKQQLENLKWLQEQLEELGDVFEHCARRFSALKTQQPPFPDPVYHATQLQAAVAQLRNGAEGVQFKQRYALRELAQTRRRFKRVARDGRICLSASSQPQRRAEEE